jgi:hypothetical protein
LTFEKGDDRDTGNTAIFTSCITFQNNQKKFFSQGKFEFIKFLCILLDKINILTLRPVYIATWIRVEIF